VRFYLPQLLVHTADESLQYSLLLGYVWVCDRLEYDCFAILLSTPPPPCFPRHQQQDFGWWRCLSVCCGFQSAPSDPLTLYFCVALYSHLPVPLPLQRVMLQQVDPSGPWEAVAVPGMPPGESATSTSQPGAAAISSSVSSGSAGPPAQGELPGHPPIPSGQPGGMQPPASTSSADGAPPQLLPGQWLVFHVPLPPRCTGLLQVERLTLSLSSSCSVAYHLTSFPCGLSGVLGGGNYPRGVSPFPTGAGVRPGVCGAMVGHVGPLPKLQVSEEYFSEGGLPAPYLACPC
jgi:hypothetical protein